VTKQPDASGGRIPPIANQFLKYFLPVAVLLGLLIAAVQYHSYAIARQEMLTSQRHGVALAAEAIGHDFEIVGADLHALAASHSLRQYAGSPLETSRQAVSEELAAFIRYKRLYAGLSYVGENGNQRIAIGATDAPVTATRSSEANAELLAAVRDLPPGGVAASPTILRGGGGPPQALIRFATPVRDLGGRTRGALILVYSNPNLMTSHLGRVLQQQGGSDFLVDADGDWLRYTNGTEHWTEGGNQRFGELYPDAWSTLLRADAGQFRTERGLFTFTTVYPERHAVRDEGGSAAETSAPFWKIVSVVDDATLSALATQRFRGGLFLYLLLLIPAALASRYVARLSNNRQLNRQRIRELGRVVEQSHDLVFITDADGCVRYVNPRFEKITGYSRREIIGRSPDVLKSGTHEAEFYDRLWKTIRRGEAFQAMFTNRKKNGELFHVQMTISPLKDKDAITGYVATGKDITSQIHTQERLLKLAFHHPLTGLPNRALFRDHLHEAAARARRGGHSVAVLFIDLDRFKKVNDSLGHQAGDSLLKQVSERLRETVRETDMVAHLGGDEFTILVDEIHQPAQVQAVSAKLLQLFEKPFHVADRELYVGASIGIALFPNDSDSVEKLMEQADTAMYQAKRAGRSQYQFYSADMTTLANERLELENRLRTAMHQREFELHFQPIVDPLRRELRGFEALIRWRQPDGTLRSPNEFIPVLEETGLVVPVTEWVLEESCRQCRRLNELGSTRVRMNVNISARSFYQGDLVGTVRTALKRSRLTPQQLVLEVTESLLVEDQQHVQKSLEQLRALGVGIAIDDFGTGYSSLAYLRRLPVNILKIDRAFINGVGPDSRDAALVSAIMAMAQELHMDVVAEGVEQRHQLDFLRQRGCDGVQGYLFSAPLPADNIASWLDRDRHWPWKAWMDQPGDARLH
jgi:diguanylate cyclase (GGDEF)-like protein/PAS domain S-box-containing protein